MTFEEWDWIPVLLTNPRGQTELKVVQLYADWKAEREKANTSIEMLGGYLEQAKEQRDKLIGALEKIQKYTEAVEELSDFEDADAEWAEGADTALTDCCDIARAVLAEVKEKK